MLIFRDISGNPLVCDCDLWWLGGWNASGQVKLSPMPKCARPKDLRNQPLRKLRPPLSCPWLSDNLPAPLELSPDQDQVSNPSLFFVSLNNKTAGV